MIFARSDNSVEESKAARDWFENYILSDREDWVAEENSGDEVDDMLNDEDEPYYNKLMERVAHDQGGHLVAEFYARSPSTALIFSAS